MAEQRCETCRFWEPDDATEFGMCIHPKLHANHGFSHPTTGDMAVSFYDGWIRTGPRFGCIHWEPTE